MRKLIDAADLAGEVSRCVQDDTCIIVDSDIGGGAVDYFSDVPFVVFVNCRFNSTDFSDGVYRLLFTDCELDSCRFDRADLLSFQFSSFEKLGEFRTFWWEKSTTEPVQFPNSISSCSFQGARMSTAKFRDANVWNCDFAGTDLSKADGLELSECMVDGARLPIPQNEERFRTRKERLKRATAIWFGDANYRWGALLMAYTGPSFYLLAFATLLYLTPPVFFLSLMEFMQLSGMRLEAPVGWQATAVPLWSLMIGWRGAISFEVIARLLLWIYVLLRSFQTIAVSNGRHAQLITGRTPTKKQQKRMWRVHRVLRILSIFVIGYLVFVYMRLLMDTIPVPTQLLDL